MKILRAAFIILAAGTIAFSCKPSPTDMTIEDYAKIDMEIYPHQ